MRKFIYICLCIVISAGAFFSCNKDFSDNESQENQQPAFLTIDEAQVFFENQSAQSRSNGSISNLRLTPGDFTPQWSQAVVAQNDIFGSVDVPITSQYRYKAIGSEFKNSKATAYVVEVTQKLVIVKAKGNNKMSSYIVTIIPDKEYSITNKGDNSENFFKIEDKGNFSGVVMFSLLKSNFVVRLNKYKHGKEIAGVFIPAKTKEQLVCNIAKARTIIGHINISRGSAMVHSRSWGEDEWNENYSCYMCYDAGCSSCSYDDEDDDSSCLMCGGSGCVSCSDEWWNISCIVCGDSGCGACDGWFDSDCGMCGGSGCWFCSSDTGGDGGGADLGAFPVACQYCKAQNWIDQDDDHVTCWNCRRPIVNNW